jgi:hypothetical protein
LDIFVIGIIVMESWGGLAAAWGDSPWFAHYYYVKPGLPDTDALVQAIRQEPYHWHETELEAGNEAVNYGREDL